MEYLLSPPARSFPTWVVSTNAQFCREIELRLHENPTLSFRGAFSKWQVAVKEIKEALDGFTNFVVVDANQVEVGGPRWVSILKDSVSSVFVIALMDDADDDHISELLRIGASAYLARPCSAAQLSSAAMAAFQGGISLSPAIWERIARLELRDSREKKLYGLTSREKDVLRLLVEGSSVQQIAEKLAVSYYTADTHLKNIHRKLGEKNSRGVVARAVREHLID